MYGTAGSAGSYLSMDDLCECVTDNVRGILKGEEKRNVLDRRKDDVRSLRIQLL